MDFHILWPIEWKGDKIAFGSSAIGSAAGVPTGWGSPIFEGWKKIFIAKRAAFSACWRVLAEHTNSFAPQREAPGFIGQGGIFAYWLVVGPF